MDLFELELARVRETYNDTFLDELRERKGNLEMEIFLVALRKMKQMGFGEVELLPYFIPKEDGDPAILVYNPFNETVSFLELNEYLPRDLLPKYEALIIKIQELDSSQ
ncbi:MAG: hypothetical protein ISS01_02075 [Nanoarchaeota archaeon]|nr:hypothetical protein [Nanoarchaeota archaeon]